MEYYNNDLAIIYLFEAGLRLLIEKLCFGIYTCNDIHIKHWEDEWPDLAYYGGKGNTYWEDGFRRKDMNDCFEKLHGIFTKYVRSHI